MNRKFQIEVTRSSSAEAYEIQLYNDWVKTVPGFSDVIIKFETDPDALDEFIDAVSAYMRRCCSQVCSYNSMRWAWSRMAHEQMTRRATKPPKGRIHGLQEPNIRNIMYAAVQVRIGFLHYLTSPTDLLEDLFYSQQ